MPAKPRSPCDQQPSSLPQVWGSQAMSLPNDDLRTTTPLHVTFGEAADVARFHKTYYPTQRNPGSILIRPGLDTVVNAERGLTAKTGEEIVSLLGAAQEAQARYLLEV